MTPAVIAIFRGCEWEVTKVWADKRGDKTDWWQNDMFVFISKVWGQRPKAQSPVLDATVD